MITIPFISAPLPPPPPPPPPPPIKKKKKNGLNTQVAWPKH